MSHARVGDDHKAEATRCEEEGTTVASKKVPSKKQASKPKVVVRDLAAHPKVKGGRPYAPQGTSSFILPEVDDQVL